MKRFTRIKILLIALISFATAKADGQWHLYAPFSGVEQMAETKGRVYFTSAGALFAYDKDNDEMITFNGGLDLHGYDITGIYAPYQATFAVAAYSDGNIDIIRDNGRIINLPDIKDSGLNTKTINTIAFSPDASSMIVATSFGIVRYNLDKMEVTDSGIYGEPVFKVGFINSLPVIYLEDGRMLMLPEGGTLRNLDTWIHLSDLAVIQLINCAGQLYGIIWIADRKRPVVFSIGNLDLSLDYTVLGTDDADYLIEGDYTAPVVSVNADRLIAFDSSGKISDTAALPQNHSIIAVSATGGLGNLWLGNRKGISNADAISGPLYIGETMSPGEMSVRNPHILHMSPSGNLYVGNRGNSNVFHELSTGFKGYQAKLQTDGTAVDLTPSGLSEPHYHSPATPSDVIYDALFIREDPTDESLYFTGDLYSGFYALSSDDATEKVHYSPLNSPLTDYWGVRVMDIAVDSRGYLWVLSERDPGLPSLMVLPPEGRAKGSSVTESDWTVIDITKDFYSNRDGKIEMSPDGRYLYLMGGTDLFVYDTSSTPELSDDTGYHVTGFRMADGSGYVDFSRISTIYVDSSDGSLWVGTFEGVLRAPEPWEVTNGSIEVIRPKVSRNDGTGLADYLLSTEKVYGISAGPAGHKWFATANSGVYMTSSDGTEILQHFTSSNSPLPSDCVYSVACDTKGSDKVYFGTTGGLLEYRSGFTAPREDYNEVKIYPNPVRPDYYGPVTIEGLVDGSEVRILSASGALVAILNSDGGTVKWDAMSGGRRLPSGVYHVLASSIGHSGKPVGKIVIVR